ncbi:MAG TPA: maleylpyruvate isomerase family mycothiol-dependent enzyme [Acidimicrobiia bacterium]
MSAQSHQPRERGLLDTRLAWMHEGTRFFDARVGQLADDDFHAPAALPRWTRAHVVAHVARNADALGNLLTWARTGVETQMYESGEQREADIEEGATRPAAVLRADLEDAQRRFAAAVASLPAEAWRAEVRTRAGRPIAAAEVPWMRAREVWVHAVDLDAGASFADLPPSFVEAFLTEVTATFTARPDCGAIELVATDTGRTWSIGPPDADEVVVEGGAGALLAWLLGRSDGAVLSAPGRGVLPAVPSWL